MYTAVEEASGWRTKGAEREREREEEIIHSRVCQNKEVGTIKLRMETDNYPIPLRPACIRDVSNIILPTHAMGLSNGNKMRKREGERRGRCQEEWESLG